MPGCPRILLAMLVLAAAAGARAQVDDPLKSPACAEALAALQAGPRDDPRRVAALRQAAAQVCFGGITHSQRPGRAWQHPPQAVAPPRIEVPHATPVPRATGVPPPPVAIERTPQPAQCNATGCWVNDGTHLRQVPLPAPGCLPQPGVVYCP